MEPPTGSATKPLTVTAYATLIERKVKEVSSAIVEGEVQRPRKTNGGALMFDFTDGECSLKCKVLPWTLRDGISHDPNEGDLVQLDIAGPEFWTKGGLLTVVVDDIELAGDGELLKKRRELIARFRAEGLTDPDAFPPLPRFPSTIGLIAGRETSGLEDVLRTLNDRYPAARVITACCPVQGASAPGALIDALGKLDLNPAVEVIILSRGGGSPRDLIAFDDERLCRAISALKTPVVAAIGHSDNIPVCNYVTHSALTPSRAAEMVVPDRAALLAELDEANGAAERAARRVKGKAEEFEARAQAVRGRERIEALQRSVTDGGRVLDAATAEFTGRVTAQLSRAREALIAAAPLLRARFASELRDIDEFRAATQAAADRPRQLTADVEGLGRQVAGSAKRIMRGCKTNWLRALDRQAETLVAAAKRTLRRADTELAREGEQLGIGARRRLGNLARETKALAALLVASDFRRRGWILGRAADGRPIRSVIDVAIDDRIQLYLHDGEVGAVADEINPQTKEAT
ncbi:MAG: exodeoxyribonuclease VII large subunit [Solirubrobacterales bacterium]